MRAYDDNAGNEFVTLSKVRTPSIHPSTFIQSTSDAQIVSPQQASSGFTGWLSSWWTTPTEESTATAEAVTTIEKDVEDEWRQVENTLETEIIGMLVVYENSYWC